MPEHSEVQNCHQGWVLSTFALGQGLGKGHLLPDLGGFAGVIDHYKSLRSSAPSPHLDQRHPGLLLEVGLTCFWNLFRQVSPGSA